jgi:hypothetical protein
MRDWRASEETKMDPRLFDILWEMHEELGSKEPIHVLSGFRSSGTNETLRKSVGGQAKNSRHIMGKAIDVHFPDVPVKRLRYAAMVRERGGVGYYPTSAIPFVHVDTDRVRHWPPMPRYELALLFPDGESKHTPSDGRPITKEDVRVARSRHKDLAVQIAEFMGLKNRTAQPTTAVASLDVPKPVDITAIPRPRPVARPQLASLGPMAVLPQPAALGASDIAERETTKPPGVAAPRPAPKSSGDLLGAFMNKMLAAFDRDMAAAPKKAPAKNEARVASVDPTAGAQIKPPAPQRKISDLPRPQPATWATAPAFDDEHPEELSYRPFAIGPILTAHEGHDHPVLGRMSPPDTGKVFELLDEPDRLFPLTFRPGKQVAELMWAGQFNGARVGSDTLMSRLKAPDPTGITTRKVSTFSQ